MKMALRIAATLAGFTLRVIAAHVVAAVLWFGFLALLGCVVTP